MFPFQANGSILSLQHTPVGSVLIAQNFSKDCYFHPRPSAAHCDPRHSEASSLAASNPLLRDRIAQALGPLVIYSQGPKKGEFIAQDIKKWFSQDMYQGKPHIVAQWAKLYPEIAKTWLLQHPYQATWLDIWDPTLTLQNKDDIVHFFEKFSIEHPGKFPQSNKYIASLFFDMWRQDHPDAPLQEIPADMVTTSASGLDPHITLENALFQLDRVSTAWAQTLSKDKMQLKKEIEEIVINNASAPWYSFAGSPILNVLEVNLELHRRYQQ